MLMVETIVIVPSAVVFMPPIPAMRIVVRPVIGRRVGERRGHRNAREANSDADIRMRFGGYAVSHSGDPESGSQRNGCKFVHGGDPL
jgi:hypothetical protein